MKVEIEIIDYIVDEIMNHPNILGTTLQERVQWLWDQVLEKLPGKTRDKDGI